MPISPIMLTKLYLVFFKQQELEAKTRELLTRRPESSRLRHISQEALRPVYRTKPKPVERHDDFMDAVLYGSSMSRTFFDDIAAIVAGRRAMPRSVTPSMWMHSSYRPPPLDPADRPPPSKGPAQARPSHKHERRQSFKALIRHRRK